VRYQYLNTELNILRLVLERTRNFLKCTKDGYVLSENRILHKLIHDRVDVKRLIEKHNLNQIR